VSAWEICCVSALFALCTDAVVEVLPVALVLLVVLVLLAGSPAAAPSPEVPPFHWRNIGPPTGVPIGPFDVVASVGEPAEAVPLPRRSATMDCRSCHSPPPKPLVVAVPELPVAAELAVAAEVPVVVEVSVVVVLLVAVVPAASVLLAEVRLPPMLEISDCRLANRLDIRLPGLVSPSGIPAGGAAGGPLGEPTPADPAPAQAPLAPPPDTLPNASNCDNRSLESVGKAPPVIALPDVPAAEEPAENGVAVLAADPLLGLA